MLCTASIPSVTLCKIYREVDSIDSIDSIDRTMFLRISKLCVAHHTQTALSPHALHVHNSGHRGHKQSIVIIGSITSSVEVHMGGDPIHARLGAELKEREEIGTTGTEVGSHFKQSAAEEQVEVQRYVGAQIAGDPRVRHEVAQAMLR